jgi:hypothetical protein
MTQPPSGRPRRRLGPGLTALLVVDLVLVAIFAVILFRTLSPADESPTPTPTAAQESPDPEPEVSPEETPDEDSEEVGEVRSFVLPSGNIHCEMTEERAFCTILAFSFEPPATPDGCDGSIGNNLSVTAGESAGFVCVEGEPPPVPGDATVLEYGEQSTVGEMTCASSTNGVLCRHNPSGEGFSVARAGYLFF